MNVAVIGTGYQGRLHLQSLAQISDVNIAAVCDHDRNRADAAAAEFGAARAYADHRELLHAHPSLDLVTVCTMPNTHREIVCAALEAGAHVLCEKPFAMNAEEGAWMVNASVAARRLLAVGFNMRWMDSAARVREFIQGGELGMPVCARGFMLADDVPWWGRHFVKAISGGGALAATAVHMLDLVRWLVGNPLPLTATASMTTVFPRKRGDSVPDKGSADAFDTEDIVFGHVRFAGGFWMSIEGAWVWDRTGWNYGFELIGDRAQATFDPPILSRALRGEIVDLHSRTPPDNSFPRSVQREIADVVAAVREERPPTRTATAEEALVTQAIVDALYASARAGREVHVEIPRTSDTTEA